MCGIFLTLLTIPAQRGILSDAQFLMGLCVAASAAAGSLWVVALCVETKARGYNAFWGLLLVIPPFILVYPFVFKDRFRKNRIAEHEVAPYR